MGSPMKKEYAVYLTLFVLGCATTNPGTEAPKSAAGRLYQKAVEDMEDGLYPEAIAGFASVKTKFPYSKFAALAAFSGAETELKRGDHMQAIAKFRSFLSYHPKHHKAAEAMLKIGDAYYAQLPGNWFFMPPAAEKDQSKTKLALAAYQSLLDAHPKSEAATEGQTKLNECRKRLANHELYVAKFYWSRQAYPATARRAEELLDNYGDIDFEAEVLWLAGASYFRAGQPARAKPHLEQLVKKYPNDSARAEAEKLLRKIDQDATPIGNDPQKKPS